MRNTEASPSVGVRVSTYLPSVYLAIPSRGSQMHIDAYAEVGARCNERGAYSRDPAVSFHAPPGEKFIPFPPFTPTPSSPCSPSRRDIYKHGSAGPRDAGSRSTSSDAEVTHPTESIIPAGEVLLAGGGN